MTMSAHEFYRSRHQVGPHGPSAVLKALTQLHSAFQSHSSYPLYEHLRPVKGRPLHVLHLIFHFMPDG